MPAKRAYGMDQEFLSLVADCYAPRSPVAGQRPRRPRGHRQPRALGLGGAGRHAAAGEPDGRPRGLVDRKPAATFPISAATATTSTATGSGFFAILAVLDKYGITPTLALDKAVADHYPFLVKEGQRRGAEFIAHGLSRRRIIHIGMSEDEEREYIRASIAAVETRHRQAPDWLVRPRFPGDAEHAQPARRGGHSLCLRLGQ